jgi:hypothetical protein
MCVFEKMKGGDDENGPNDARRVIWAVFTVYIISKDGMYVVIEYLLLKPATGLGSHGFS